MNDEKVFLLALSEGMGFTEACEVSLNDPKEASKEITQSKPLREYAINAVRNYKVNLLKAARAYTDKDKHEQAEDARRKAAEAPNLVLWGDALVDIKILTPEVVAASYLRIKDAKDTATALGMTYREYADYVAQHPAIAQYVRSILPNALIV